MDGIRLKGFRSLVDTGMLELKPITIIVGQNSSGKSTFLRTLPLIAQSVSTRSNSPVLWYGDFVDFGEIKDVVSTFSTEKTISIEYELGTYFDENRIRVYNRRIPANVEPFTVSLTLKEEGGKTVLCAFSIKSNSDDISAKIQDNKVFSIDLNGRDVSEYLKGYESDVSSFHLVPNVYFEEIGDGQDLFPAIFEPILKSALYDASLAVLNAVHKKTSNETARKIVQELSYRSEPNFTEALPSASELRTWKVFCERSDSPVARRRIDRIRELIFLARLPSILEVLQSRVANVAASISYVGPARANSERYYRIRELAVDQIDPRGENLAMFLNSLSEFEKTQFSDWVERSVGHAVKVIKDAGHVQLHLREQSSDAFHNLADTGYGFSQILPVLAQLWAKDRRRPRYMSSGLSIVAIEQPELHLHPAYQAQLADVFVNSIGGSTSGPGRRNQSKFVIETHSEAFINRMGELIYEGKVKPEDVNVLVFEKSDRSEETSVSVAKFDDEGILMNWPQGFFARRRP